MPTPAPDLSTGAHMVADDGRTLPLLGVELRGHCCAGLARVTLRQQFHNPYAEPLRVRYLVPLPADAAVGGYAFELPGERIVGEIARKQAARERFERALIEGRSAALLEQQRASVFEQELGNIPPGAVVTTELTLEHPLTWLAEGAWEWRFPTVVAPRYTHAVACADDPSVRSVPVLDGAVSAGATLTLDIGDAFDSTPRSPSHSLTTTASGGGGSRAGSVGVVGLAGEAGTAALDRDVVVRWSVAAQVPKITLALARRAGDERAMGLLTIVPPLPSTTRESVARDLILLIDVSGSMGGEPLDQAKRVLRALIAGLAPTDRLEMIAFASRAYRWNRTPAACDHASRTSALAWIEGLSARGSTNMHTAIIEALTPLRDAAQRQILVISDGLIGFEQEIIREAVQRLPRHSRVHCLGVGHAVNRSLTRPLARAGHGVELIVAPGEDPESVVAQLLERTVEPLLCGLELEGPALARAPLLDAAAPVSATTIMVGDLFAGTPTRVPIACWPEGGRLTLRARSAGGEWVETITVPATPAGSGDPALIRHFAREQVEDVETSIAAGIAGNGDAQIEALGLRYAIATRLTSWIAVSSQVTVDPTAATRTVEQPHELAAGMSAEGVGLRRASSFADAPDLADVLAAKRSGPKILGFISLPGEPRPPKGAAPAPSAPSPAARRKRAHPERALRHKSRVRETSRDEPAIDEFEGLAKEERSTRGRGRVGRARFAPTVVRATILVDAAGKLVLGLELPADLYWLPAENVIELRFAGRTISVRLDRAATTKPGQLDAGVTVRVSLDVDGELPTGEFTLELCGLRLTARR